MTFWISFGLYSFRARGGLFPEVQLGIVAFGWCRGLITARMREAIQKALRALGRNE